MMRGAEFGAGGFGERPAGVRPGEGVRQGQIEVVEEGAQPALELPSPACSHPFSKGRIMIEYTSGWDINSAQRH